MKDLNQAVDLITRDIGLDQHEIDQRKAFLELGETDIDLLQRIHKLLQDDKEGFSDAFYQHLVEFPEMRTLLPDAETMARLRAAQSAYFDRLTAGDYGQDYIRNRLKVGVVHQRIGLEPKWYIGAYRKYLSELLPILWRMLADQPETFLAAYDAALKVVSFDMGLALDTYAQAAQQEVVQHRNYLQQVISGMPAGLIVVNDTGDIRSMNDMMRKMLDISEEYLNHPRPLNELIESATLAESVAQVRATGKPCDRVIVTLKRECAGTRHFELSIRPTVLGRENLLLLIAQDVTFQLEATRKLQESEEQFRLTFNQAAVGIAHANTDGEFIRINRKLCEITGYTEAELLHRDFWSITHPDDVARDTTLFNRLAKGEISEYSREKRYIHKQGHAVWANVTVSSMRDALGRQRFIGLVEDISRRKEAEEELRRLVNHDALTGLPNRLLLEDRLGQAIAHAHRAGKLVAVMFIDLDRFKNINDSLGHDAGDEVIVEIASRIANSLREADTVARQGGDEFVVVLPDMAQEEDAAIVAQKILQSLFQPMVVSGQELFPTGSIGISLYPRDGQDAQTLLKHADAAMYRAKAEGRNDYQFYAGSMGTNAMDSLKLEGALRRALERNEFLLHYQPQVDIRSGAVVGVEALLRWQPQGKEMVSPADFIPIAEETGLIVPIGEWVLATACAQHKAWRDAGLPPIRIGVNLSARQFQRQDLAKRVARLLEEMDCTPDCLALEITESDVMQNPEAAVEILRQLHAMGMHLAIDDFGTGYSSLSYLKRFPIDCLKIDRSFVRDITSDADDAMIVNSVIALAHSMKLSVIAEGVETAQQLDFLSDHGCDQMQGYYFSKPVPADQIAKLLQAVKPETGHVAAA
ncbi:PAS domain S-box-containing protein/diguanylate cyclase (GGDEF)-like protein [Paucimonas lemoignei]|uniref:Diguanylate cyclase DosC n=1 Tax=Paucimonas lemoignei TaxID=29443 RepID=A0A4R3HUH0_PAULE|nr:EAL domain-containing protein [Paucimonas lemoignei]TCS35655.1 PAS domain S-box-containing protein/diguanylate cyclase (GGDEF)-like protein [Paucimonas lemoignei]